MTYKILWLVIIPVVFLVCYKREELKWFPFYFLGILLFFRYDSVSDYLPYVQIFDEVKRTGEAYSSVEIGWVWINRLLSNIPYSWYFLIGASSLLPFALSKEKLKEYDVPVIGCSMIFFLDYYFYFDSILRQCIAISLFMISTKYILSERKHILLFFLINIASSLVHTSALIAFLLYPLFMISKKIELSNKSIVLILITSYILYLTSAIVKLNDSLLSFLPMLSQYTEVAIYNNNWGFSYLFMAILTTLPLLLLRYQVDEKTKMLLYIAFYSGCLTLALSNLLTFRRVFFYTFIYSVISVSLLIKYYLNHNRRAAVFIIYLLLFVRMTSFVNSYFEDAKYRTCLSENFANKQFFVRGSRAMYSSESWAIEKDRNSFITYRVKDE